MTILEVELMTALEGLLREIDFLRRYNQPVLQPLPLEEQARSTLVRARMKHEEDLKLKEEYGKTCNKAANPGDTQINDTCGSANLD